MDDMWVRFTSDMAARVTGPMKFRLVLQPLMAAFFAIRSGLADARAGRPPYLWALVSGHWSAWQAARVEVAQQVDEARREQDPVEERVVETLLKETNLQPVDP